MTDLTINWTSNKVDDDPATVQLPATTTVDSDGKYIVRLTSTNYTSLNIEVSAYINNPATKVKATDKVGFQGVPAIDLADVNGWRFSEKMKFPSSGFDSAFFTIKVRNASNSDYNWTVNKSWLSIDNTGKVTFNSEPSSANKTVTVTATPKSGVGSVLTYQFTISKWFITKGPLAADILNNADAVTYCSGRGAILPALADLSNAPRGSVVVGPPGTRAVDGALWSEWGSATAYGNFSPSLYWSSDKIPGGGGHYATYLSFGGSQILTVDKRTFVACYKNI